MSRAWKLLLVVVVAAACQPSEKAPGTYCKVGDGCTTVTSAKK
jgi:hypothetical protein